ncbi:MAG TPA: phosphoadenylyl-sulfate reductase [Bacteroidia bacterium]|nr:phosphoadenylyl-sulfate reductase [Bacteroidia bacterium]
MKSVEELNNVYASLRPLQRIEKLYSDSEKVLLTSSFGTTSVILLHMFHEVNPAQEIIFLDTTYHFAETLRYKEMLTERFGLNVRTAQPEEWKNAFTNSDQTWSKDPDLCCSINKVEPLDKLKAGYEVWVSGLMQSQNNYRKQMTIFEQKETLLKFYPIIDLSEEEAKKYIAENNLPPHPLVAHGFNSVGCIHCTVKGRGREGRWVNRNKTECGLHI